MEWKKEITEILYAGNQILLADTEDQLQRSSEILTNLADMNTSTAKTKATAF
jgi:hypothetical protein